ncbi:MAG: S53 family peptidase [Bryobacteraceae bacterium]
MSARKTISLLGSEHRVMPGAKVEGPVQGDEPVEVTITLKAPANLETKVKEMLDQPPAKRKYLSREDFAKTCGQSEGNIAKVEKFARENNLTVKSKNPEQHTVQLVGTAREMSQAFNVFLERYSQEGVSYRARTGPVHIPEELGDLILSVDGLDERPVAKPKFRMRPTVAPHAGPSVSYNPQDVARLYNFPTGADGTGECIGIIELGGGFRQQDLQQYFANKAPTVTAVAVDKGHNKPTGNPNGPDGEVMLDIEVCGSIAPKCQIAVYFAPNTNKGFIDAINACVHDTARKPSVISISWGGPEDGGGFSQASLAAFHQAFQAAALMGVTVFAAAGDGGSTDGLSSGNHCDYPASDNLVTGCGGTSLLTTNNTTIKSETVWNDNNGGATGGGVSTVYPCPTYQQGLQVTMKDGTKTALTGRGVPDICGDADPNTGYNVLVDGQSFPIGGTSAVAPLMAGLCALMNQELGKPVGALNPTLYSLQKTGTQVCRDITTGNNGAYAASQGWDACTGLGVPIGTALLSALEGTSKTTA